MQTSSPLIRTLGAALLLPAWLAMAEAATIDVRPLDNGSTLIVVEGDFDSGDVDVFRAKVASIPPRKATVAFQSDGGSLVAAIRIGSLIREKKFTTVVPDRALCASACALAWLGGTRRLIGHGSGVGFHAAYVVKSYGPIESAPGNAILGAYLNQLGLPEKAILYITHAAPTSMQWMSLEDAAEHGIAVAPLSPLQGNVASAIPGGSDHHGAETPERRATNFVRALVAWSAGPKSEVMPILEGFYAEQVLYDGKSTSRQSLLRSKHRSADRWTERAYTIRPGSLSTTCAPAGETCRVTGVMNWAYYNAKTANRSRGEARFEYRVALSGASPRIVAEKRSVNERPQPPSALVKARRDIQQLISQVSKLIP